MPARRPAAGDGEHRSPPRAGDMHGLDGAVGQDLVLGDERAVDVGEHDPDRWLGWAIDHKRQLTQTVYRAAPLAGSSPRWLDRHSAGLER